MESIQIQMEKNLILIDKQLTSQMTMLKEFIVPVQKNDNYSLKIGMNKGKNKCLIYCRSMNSLINYYYLFEATLDELRGIDKIFFQFDSISEAVDNIKSICRNKGTEGGKTDSKMRIYPLNGDVCLIMNLKTKIIQKEVDFDFILRKYEVRQDQIYNTYLVKINDLEKENSFLKKTNVSLTSENAALKQTNVNLYNENSLMKQIIQKLQENNPTLLKKRENLDVKNGEKMVQRGKNAGDVCGVEDKIEKVEDAKDESECNDILNSVNNLNKVNNSFSMPNLPNQDYNISNINDVNDTCKNEKKLLLSNSYISNNINFSGVKNTTALSQSTQIKKNSDQNLPVLLSNIIQDYRELDILINHLQSNSLNIQIGFKLIYSANVDGDKISDFETKVNIISPTLVLIKTKEGFVFGGYLSKSWPGKEGEIIDDKNSFLFSLTNQKIYNKKGSQPVSQKLKEYCPLFLYGFGLGQNYLTNKHFTLPLKNLLVNWEGFSVDYELSGGKPNFEVEFLEVFKVIKRVYI